MSLLIGKFEDDSLIHCSEDEVKSSSCWSKETSPPAAWSRSPKQASSVGLKKSWSA